MSSPIILITGASRGIGAATARLAAAEGYDVCVNFRQDAAAAERVADDVRRLGRRALAVQADVSVEAEVRGLFQTMDRELGTLTALVNNAGITARAARVEQMDADRLARMFAVNVMGPFLCAREAVLRLSRRHGGSGGAIVNVSSGAARSGSPGEYVDYAASKAALDTLTIGLSKEVAAEGVRVNSVRAGVTYTGIHATTGDPARVDRLAPLVPMKRGGQPEEIAAAILWLLSDAASYTTGAILDVTGGF